MRAAVSAGLDPRFAIVRELGVGADAVVYEVHDRIQNVDRALKLAQRRGQTRRFRSEYRRLSELRHPHIVRSYDYGTASGLPYYTLEIVRGVQLGDFPERGDYEVLGLIAIQLLDALATLHARGWVHRDIKPKNLLVVGHGPGALVRLIDPGLMVDVGSRGHPAGTLPYIAPEVARGERIDGRADLYSLGVVLYECLVPEDAATTVEEAARRLATSPTAPHRLNPAIPVGLSELVMRLVEPSPERRFDSADAAADALCQVPELHLGRSTLRAMAERLLRGGAVAHRPALVQRLVR